jgi:predicted HicB family RNase H-like nuclease
MNNILEHKGYVGSVEFNADDKVFYGKILGIKDLVTFEGESVSELEHAFQEMIEDYLVTCKKLKKEPEKTYKGTFNVRISSEMHKKAALIASRKNISLNNFVKFALGWVIQHEKEIEPALQHYSEEGILTN